MSLEAGRINQVCTPFLLALGKSIWCCIIGRIKILEGLWRQCRARLGTPVHEMSQNKWTSWALRRAGTSVSSCFAPCLFYTELIIASRFFLLVFTLACCPSHLPITKKRILYDPKSSSHSEPNFNRAKFNSQNQIRFCVCLKTVLRPTPRMWGFLYLLFLRSRGEYQFWLGMWQYLRH